MSDRDEAMDQYMRSERHRKRMDLKIENLKIARHMAKLDHPCWEEWTVEEEEDVMLITVGLN